LIYSIERCSFSWHKIYPGHGIRFVRGDSRTYFFAGSKARCAFNIKRSSRKTLWTGDWRKAHKKDSGKIIKKRTKRKAVRFQKDIVGMTLDEIIKQQNTKQIQRTKLDPAVKFVMILYSLIESVIERKRNCFSNKKELLLVLLIRRNQRKVVFYLIFL
jgi:large subunit ribosomal protein L24e